MSIIIIIVVIIIIIIIIIIWEGHNSMDTSSDKQTKSHTRKLGHG